MMEATYAIDMQTSAVVRMKRPGGAFPGCGEVRRTAAMADSALTAWCDRHGVEWVHIRSGLVETIGVCTPENQATAPKVEGSMLGGKMVAIKPVPKVGVDMASKPNHSVEAARSPLSGGAWSCRTLPGLAEMEAIEQELAIARAAHNADRTRDMARCVQAEARARKVIDERDQFSAALIEAQRVIAGLRGGAEPVERGTGLLTENVAMLARWGR